MTVLKLRLGLKQKVSMNSGKGTMNELTNQSVTEQKKLAERVKYLQIELPVIPKYNSEFMCFQIVTMHQTKFDFGRKPFGVRRK